MKPSIIEKVRVEGLVLLKMIKQYQDEALSSQSSVNGILLGLLKGKELEITNCFPLPKTQDDDPNANHLLSAFEGDMIRNLRQGPEVPWECEVASTMGRCSFTRLLDEIPVALHNSHLVSILLSEIVENQEVSRSNLSNNSSILDLAPPLPTDHPGRYSALNLGMATSLEQQLRLLLVGLDTVHDYQYQYQRSFTKSQASGGGKSSNQEARNRELAPIRFDMGLISGQLDFYCSTLSQMCGQTMGKLMMTESLQSTNSAGPSI